MKYKNLKEWVQIKKPKQGEIISIIKYSKYFGCDILRVGEYEKYKHGKIYLTNKTPGTAKDIIQNKDILKIRKGRFTNS